MHGHARNFLCLPGFSELLSELRQGYSDGKSDVEIIEPHLRADLLIIDDLGKGRNTDWELSILDTLISERYNRNQLIMATTNFTEQEETTLKERSLAGDKADKEHYISDTIRKKGGRENLLQTSGNVLFRKSEWTRPENRGRFMSVERIFRSNRRFP